MLSWLNGKIGNASDVIRRQKEEKLYQIVLKELESGIRRDGLWCKALTHANFDEGQAKSEYVRLRIQSIVDEEIIAEEKRERETAALHEKVKQLAADGCNRKEFEAWFFTTSYTHRQYDREYQNFLLNRLVEESNKVHNR